MNVTADTLDRTIKRDLDLGRADTVEGAQQLARARVLQVVVGVDVATTPTMQAALLTIANAGARAFLGGVLVSGQLDWACLTRWGLGMRAGDAVEHYGGRVTTEPPRANHPTIVIGTLDNPPNGAAVMWVTFDRWAGGVVTDPARRLGEREFPLAGVLAGGLAVSEAFRHSGGSVTAGRRDVGVSLWDPGVPWTGVAAAGPRVEYLPQQLWILGLGHLGQAHLWALGFLPYLDPTEACWWLVDFDTVVDANRSTGLLVRADTPAGTLKTRLAAKALEQLGFSTRIVERRFNNTFRPGSSEPRWALAGLDAPEPRRYLGTFDVAVDLGIGSSAEDFTGIHLHGFPSAGDPSGVFTAGQPNIVRRATPAAWAAVAADDPCGVVQLEGVAVGAAFVGAVAATISIGEILRLLAGEEPTAVLSCTLNAPAHLDTFRVGSPATNPGFVRVA